MTTQSKLMCAVLALMVCVIGLVLLVLGAPSAVMVSRTSGSEKVFRIPDDIKSSIQVSSGRRSPAISDAGASTRVTRPSIEDARRDCRLLIRLVSAGTGQPLEGFRVVLMPVGKVFSATEVDGKLARLGEIPETDGEGEVEFIVPPNQELLLESWEHDQGLRIKGLGSGEERKVTFPVICKVKGRLVGRVVDSTTGYAVASAKVYATEWLSSWVAKDGENARNNVGECLPVEVDPWGYFTLDGLYWGDQYLEITAPGYGLLCRRLEGELDLPTDVLVMGMQSGAELSVRIVGTEWMPPSGMRVRVAAIGPSSPRSVVGAWDPQGDVNWTSLTYGEGSLVFSDLPPGVQLSVSIDGRERRATQTDDLIVLSPGQSRQLQISIEGDSGFRVTGN